MLSWERVKVIPPKVRDKVRMTAFPLLFNMVLAVLTRADRQGKKASKLERRKYSYLCSQVTGFYM